MHLSYCISPNLFLKETYDEEVFHELKRVLNETKSRSFLILDHNELIKEKYKKNIKDIDNDDYIKQIEILLSFIENEFSDRYIKIGEGLEDLYIKSDKNNNGKDFSFYKFYKNIISNLKIIKNKNKNNYFYILCSHKSDVDKKIDFFYKFIVGSSFDTHTMKKRFDSFIDSKKISNEKVRTITKDFIVPLMWNSKEISFFVKDINFYNNHDRFKSHVKILLDDIIDNNEYSNNLRINIITGSNKENAIEEKQIQNNIIDELKKIDKFKGLTFNLIFHYDSKKVRDIHSRAILADNIVIAFEVIPSLDRLDRSRYEKRFNDISIKKSYFSTAKSLLLK